MDGQTKAEKDFNRRALLAALSRVDASAAVAAFLVDLEAAWDALPEDVRLQAERAAVAQELNGRLDFGAGEVAQ